MLAETQSLKVSLLLGGPVSDRGQVGRTGVCFHRKTPISCPHRESPLPQPRKGMCLGTEVPCEGQKLERKQQVLS